MGKESDLWEDVRDNLGRIGHFQRIENSIGSGTPDVSYTFYSKLREMQRSGWLELKVIDQLPQSDDCMFVSHFRKAQRVWHTRHDLYRGTSFVLLYIKRTKTYWLFTGKEACKWMGRNLNLEDYAKMNLVMTATGAFPTSQLLRVL